MRLSVKSNDEDEVARDRISLSTFPIRPTILTGNSQAKVIDRDARTKFECIKGDPYIIDMARTKGHVGMLNAGCWNPRDRTQFLTASMDGSVRFVLCYSFCFVWDYFRA